MYMFVTLLNKCFEGMAKSVLVIKGTYVPTPYQDKCTCIRTNHNVVLTRNVYICTNQVCMCMYVRIRQKCVVTNCVYYSYVY